MSREQQKDGFDLDAASYTDQELETMLNLRAGYTDQQVELARHKLSQQLFSYYASMGPEKQQDIMNFLDMACARLQRKLVDPSYSTRATQYGGNFLVQNADARAGVMAKLENGRITSGGSVDVPAGFMNPLNVRTIMQAISIDSRFRSNYYATKSTNFDLTLPSIQKNVVSMRVASIELPITYYAVSRSMGNSTFVIISNSAPGTGWLVTLPDGNYEQSWAGNSNAAPLETAMNDALGNAMPGTLNASGAFTAVPAGTKLDTGKDISFTIDRISGKAVFGYPPASGLVSTFGALGFSLRFNVDVNGNLNMGTNIQLRLGWQLGYRAAEYSATSSAVSEGICLVSGPRYGFISIEDYQKNMGPAMWSRMRIPFYRTTLLRASISQSCRPMWVCTKAAVIRA